jgi:hypothetical protein
VDPDLIPVQYDGRLIPYPIASAANGAVALSGGEYGWTIPVGSVGNGSFMQMGLPLFDAAFSPYNGKRVRMTALFAVTNYVERGYNSGIFTDASANASVVHSLSTSYDAARGLLKWVFEVTPIWDANNKAGSVRPFAQMQSTAAATAESKIKLIGLYWSAIAVAQPDEQKQVMLREVIRAERKKKQVLPGSDYIVVTANSKEGSGADFTGKQAIANAIASIKDASADRQYEIRCTGEFVASATADFTILVDLIKTFVYTKPFVHLLGTGSGASLCGGLPSGTANLDLYDTLRQDSTSRVENFFINSSNVRYGTHFEGSGGTKNAARHWKAVHVKSDTSNALGYGGSSGEVTRFEDCIFETGGGSSIYIHDNTNWLQPALYDFARCEIRVGAQSPGRAMQLQSLGAGMRSTVRLTDCVVPSGAVLGFLDTWTGPPKIDHADMRLVAPGHEPRAVEMSDFKANALRIVSASAGVSSTVVVDHTSKAFAAIFGDPAQDAEFVSPLWRLSRFGYERVTGGVGLSGWAISGLDIGETNRTATGGGNYAYSLGKRLGNCSSVNKTLTVVVDGVSKNIVFNKNYDGTAAASAPSYNNAAILAEINAALGASAVAGLVPYGRYNYPQFKGNSIRVNSDTTAILKGMGVIFAGRSVARRALSSDARIDGIALDDAAVGKNLRVISCGEIFTGSTGEWFRIAEANASAYSVGALLGIDPASPGYFVPDAPNKVLRIVSAGIALLT